MKLKTVGYTNIGGISIELTECLHENIEHHSDEYYDQCLDCGAIGKPLLEKTA